MMVHWEDLGRDNAITMLERYKDKYCSFNDDMQGTGAVAAGALLAAIKASGLSLSDQKIIIYGAGTAGVGIAEQLAVIMQEAGLSIDEINKKFWLLGRNGVIFNDNPKVNKGQLRFARDKSERENFSGDEVGLLELVKTIEPTALLGCSTHTGAFKEDIIRTMAEQVEYPIIFPLSNPTSKAEALPEDLVCWTYGKALIATGSPFEPVKHAGKDYNIAQCNNAFAFPGIGLGAVLVGATKISDNMLSAAAYALAELSPISNGIDKGLLPDLEDLKEVTTKVATTVIEMARKEGLATLNDNIDAMQLVKEKMWEPAYLPVKAE